MTELRKNGPTGYVLKIAWIISVFRFSFTPFAPSHWAMLARKPPETPTSPSTVPFWTSNQSNGYPKYQNEELLKIRRGYEQKVLKNPHFCNNLPKIPVERSVLWKPSACTSAPAVDFQGAASSLPPIRLFWSRFRSLQQAEWGLRSEVTNVSGGEMFDESESTHV